LPVGKSAAGVPDPWTLTSSLALSGTWIHVQHVEACPDIGPICATQPQMPYRHDQQLYSNDLTLDAELGVLPHLAVQVVAALRQTTDRIHFLDLMGAPYTPPVPDFHHRNETLVGPTDPWLLLHTAGTLGSYTFAGRLGGTFPIGSTVTNPFVLGRQGLPHEHIQFGTGTFDPLMGAAVERRLKGVTLSLWTLDRLVLGTNSYGYQAGHRLLFGASAQSTLGLTGFSFLGGLDVYHETAETWNGVVEQEGNLGRTDILLDLSASWRVGKSTALTLGVKVPLHSFVVGEQASYPAIVTLGISSAYAFASNPP
jgi:hypothetical protein